MSNRQYPIHQVNALQPNNAILGDEWFNPITNKLFKFLAVSGNPQWTEIQALSTSSDATQLAVGNTTQRPTNPNLGMTRFNTDFNSLEVFLNGSWMLITSTDSATINGYKVNYLIVGGGGGGGAGIVSVDNGGGGGAGGVLQGTMQLNVGTTFTVTIGAGGANGAQGTNSSITSTLVNFSNVVAIGGGGGASNVAGTIGGSGGGGAASSFSAGYAGTYGQGYAGSTAFNATPSFAAGAGGGAGGPGGTSTAGAGGPGGPGLGSTISGTLTYYGGGGGASTTAGYAPGLGGVGGGGKGGLGNGPQAGTAGTVNTGGGGGGSNSITGTVLGPSGGSGVIIISYASPVPRSISGTITSYTNNNVKYWVHTFTSSSTYIA